MKHIVIPDFHDFIFAPMSSNAWALLNLLLVIVGIFLAVLALADYLVNKRREKRIIKTATENSGTLFTVEEKYIWKNKFDWLIIAEFLGFAGVLVFLFTQSMNSFMVLMNRMTVAHTVIFIVEIVALRLVYRRERI